MDIDHPLIITLALMAGSLITCAALFIAMKSTAVITKKTYQLGGAVAAFFLIFPLSSYIYSNTSSPEKKIKAREIPTGYKEISFPEADATMAIPEKYRRMGKISIHSYAADNPSEMLIVSTAPNDHPENCSDLDKMVDDLQEWATSSPKIFSGMQFGIAEFSPINGFNSAVLPGSVTIDGMETSLVLRSVCDKRLKSLVNIFHTDTPNASLMISTLYFN